jgi:hypothetical protein
LNELLLANALAINQFCTRVHSGLDSTVPAAPIAYYGFDTRTCSQIDQAAAAIAVADHQTPTYIFRDAPSLA